MIPLPRCLNFSVLTAALAVFCFGLSNGLADDESPATFDAANLLYEKGNFSEAVVAYEKLINEGTRTSALLFNTGNACFKTDQIGLAVAFWLQAEALDPRNNRIQINLEFARESVTGGATPVPLWPEQLKVLTLNEWAVIALGSFWIFFCCLALGVWKPKLRATLRVPVALSGVGLVVVTTLLIITTKDRSDTISAVVTKPEAVVRFGPLPESQSAFVARDGSEFRVTDRKDGWLRVEDSTGREGWLTADQVVLLQGGKILNQ